MRILRDPLWHFTSLDLFVLFFCVAQTWDLDERAIDDDAAFRREALSVKLFVETVEQLLLQTEIFELFRERPDRLGIRNGVGKGQAEEVAKGYSVTNLKFCLIVGKVVQGFQYENLEHKEHVEGGPTRVGEPFFVADFGEIGTKNCPIDERVEFRKDVVDLINFIKMIFKVEEGKLAHEKAKISKKTWKNQYD